MNPPRFRSSLAGNEKEKAGSRGFPLLQSVKLP
jgi:hypothetical protein